MYYVIIIYYQRAGFQYKHIPRLWETKHHEIINNIMNIVSYKREKEKHQKTVQYT